MVPGVFLLSVILAWGCWGRTRPLPRATRRRQEGLQTCLVCHTNVEGKHKQDPPSTRSWEGRRERPRGSGTHGLRTSGKQGLV